MRFPFFRNRDSVKNGILISIRRTGDGFHPGLFRIDTDFTEYTGADAVQQPVHRVGNPMDIANMVLFLCSEKAGFITGENICIDGGMTKQMIYHGDCGWRFDI